MPANNDFNTALLLDLLVEETPAVGLTDERDLGWTGRYCAIDSSRRVTLDDIAELQALPTETVFVSQPFAGRPDLLADRLYGNPELAWILKIANNLTLNADFTTSLQIEVPSRRDVESLFLINGRNRN